MAVWPWWWRGAARRRGGERLDAGRADGGGRRTTRTPRGIGWPHLAAELRAPAATRDKYCIFSHSRSGCAAAWLSGGGGALNGDRDALERAWRVLRRDHWFAAVLGDGHETRDAVLIFEHLLGLPVVGAPNIAQRFRLAGANQGGQHRSCESTLFHGCTRNALNAETAREIAAANQADVALYESAKSAYEALARARAPRCRRRRRRLRSRTAPSGSRARGRSSASSPPRSPAFCYSSLCLPCV